MPRGEHFKKAEDEDILAQFDKSDVDRKALTTEEVQAAGDGLEITVDTTRQRLMKLKREGEVDSEKHGTTLFWYLKGRDPWSDGHGVFGSAFAEARFRVFADIYGSSSDAQRNLEIFRDWMHQGGNLALSTLAFVVIAGLVVSVPSVLPQAIAGFAALCYALYLVAIWLNPAETVSGRFKNTFRDEQEQIMGDEA